MRKTVKGRLNCTKFAYNWREKGENSERNPIEVSNAVNYSSITSPYDIVPLDSHEKYMALSEPRILFQLAHPSSVRIFAFREKWILIYSLILLFLLCDSNESSIRLI